ncbi:3-oxoacyl-ACP reductase [Sesbania bispinosa]|nr:3-oxoacyl-ACP reductase [Sesbania bispinosa]
MVGTFAWGAAVLAHSRRPGASNTQQLHDFIAALSSHVACISVRLSTASRTRKHPAAVVLCLFRASSYNDAFNFSVQHNSGRRPNISWKKTHPPPTSRSCRTECPTAAEDPSSNQ